MHDPRIHFFDRLADDWDHDEQDPAETIQRVEAQSELLRLVPGQDLLEVGCGTGQLTGWLARQVAPGRVTAVDFSNRMIEKARGKEIDAELLLHDVCSGPLPEGSFDVVLCFHSFPHFRDQPAAVGHLAGALRPGGRLIVMHLSSRDKINAFHDNVGGHVAGDHLPDEPTWNEMVQRHGLEPVAWIDREELFFCEARASGS